jgi:hypothetical protein
MISMAIASQAGQDSAKIDDGIVLVAGSIMLEYVSWKVGGILKVIFESCVMIYGTKGRECRAVSLENSALKSPLE